MGLPANVIWEVRTTGSDTNGGAFVAGASGTDFSQQNSKNTVGSNISTTDAVANGTTTITSATAAFTAAIVGNIIYLAGGSGAIAAGWYQVTAFTNSTTITVDRTVAASTGMTLNIGGAMLTWGAVIGSGGPLVDGNTVYIQNGGATTYSITSAIALQISGVIGLQVIGYDVTRGDNTGNKPTLTSATTTVDLISLNAKKGWLFKNLKFTHTGATRGSAFRALGGMAQLITIDNCLFDGVLHALCGGNIGAESNFWGTLVDCEIRNCTGDAIQASNTTGQVSVRGCYIHDNSGAGVLVGNPGSSGNMLFVVEDCYIYNNGAKGIDVHYNCGIDLVVRNNTIYKNTGDGLFSAVTTSNMFFLTLENNIIYGNTGVGVNLTSAFVVPVNRNNAYGSNTGGNRSANLAAGTNDVSLTADPLTSATNPTLNSTAGGGAACKAAGFPGSFFGIATGYPDIGCLQSQAAAGGGGLFTNSFSGGML